MARMRAKQAEVMGGMPLGRTDVMICQVPIGLL